MSTVRIQVRRGTAAEWATVNPILAAGEMGLESDTNFIKFGDGSSVWTSLAYANEPLANLENTLADYVSVADLGVANGVATLNSSGKVPSSQLDISELSQDAVNSALVAGSGITKTYDDAANTITLDLDSSVVALKSEVTELAQDAVNAAVVPGTGITRAYDDAANTLTLGIDTTVVALKSELTERAQDAVNEALVVSGNLTKNYNDPAGTLTITLSDSPQFTGTVSAVEVNATDAVFAGTVAADTINVSNLNVTGTSTTVDSQSLSISDPLIYIGAGNQANVNDLGFVAHFNDGTYQHSGLVRDHVDGTWKLFSGVTTEPTNGTINLTTHTKDNLEIGLLSATAANIGSVTNSEIQRLSGITSGIQDQLDSKLTIGTAAGTYAPIANPTFTGTVSLPNSTIITANIADSAITSAKIADGTIVNADISGTAAIAKTKISGTAVTLTDTGSITTSMIADSAITSAKIADGTIANSDIADGAITSAKILDGAIVNADINVSAAIDKTKIAGTAITQADTGTITSSMIADGAILNADIAASAAIDATKIAGTAVTLLDTGTITSVMIADGTIVDADINASASIAQSKISGLESALASKAPLASPTFTGTVSGVTKSMVGLGSVDNTSDANKPISTATQAALDLKAPLASPTFTGTVILPTGTVTSGMILDGTILNADINASAGIAATKIAGTAVTQADTGTVATAMIADSAITSAKIADGTIVNADISATAAIETSKISGLDTALAAKAPLASPTFTGTTTAGDVTITGNLTVQGTTTTISATNLQVDDSLIYLADNNTTSDALEIGFFGAYKGAGDSTHKHTGLVRDHADSKWKLVTNMAEPSSTGIDFTGATYGILKAATFEGNLTGNVTGNVTGVLTGSATLNSSGLTFSDGTVQVSAGVPSITTIGTTINANANLSTIGLTARDQMIPVAGTVTITIPTNATTAYPVGTSVDFYQSSGSGASFVAASGVTFINTPGLKFRATGSVATAMKVATDTWLIFGDLSA